MTRAAPECHILSRQYPKAGRERWDLLASLSGRVEPRSLNSPLISIKENKSLYNRLPIVPHQNWLTWPPMAAGEPDKVSIWSFQPSSWEAGSASVENGVGGMAVGFNINRIRHKTARFSMSKNNSIKYLPQITMLLKHIFLNFYLVELGITVTDGRVVFTHNLLFLRKLSLSWDPISSNLLGTSLFGWSDEK